MALKKDTTKGPLEVRIYDDKNSDLLQLHGCHPGAKGKASERYRPA